MKYFRDNINKMAGYVPGEQPKLPSLIKLNTNENPYPPSPKVAECLKNFNSELLRLYPNPTADALRDKIAEIFCMSRDNIIMGNGSDDILTIVMRSFAGENDKIACFSPSYSLYPILAKIQNAETIEVPLNKNDFSFPEELLDKNSLLFQSIKEAKVFFLTRPNAPTGINYPIEFIERFCTIFDGIVFIDEAYADFADDNSLQFLAEHDNVIVSRTLSKSYSLAGIRLGWAMASKGLIEGMMKVRDSYNVNMLTQSVALAAIGDREYFESTVARIKSTRKYLTDELLKLGFSVLPSSTNFLFVSPPDKNGKQLFEYLRHKNIIVRYFPGKMTGNYLRITIGTDKQISELIACIKNFIGNSGKNT